MKEIKLKTCFKCNKELSVSEFYKHKKMKDGYLGKCKTCTKTDIREREEKLKKNPEWNELEKARHRDKYYRLGYRTLYKQTPEDKKRTMKKYHQKYPEKYLAAKYTEIYLDKEKGFNLHHWSYNQKDWLDIIKLTIKEHAFLHRHLVYDQSLMLHRTREGVLLDTKEKHIEYLEYCKKTYKL